MPFSGGYMNFAKQLSPYFRSVLLPGKKVALPYKLILLDEV